MQAADLDLDGLLALIPAHFDIAPVPAYPPVFEDIALVVDETLPAEQVAALIRQTGGKLLREVRLFDVFRGGPDRRRQEEPGLRPGVPGA